MKSKFVPLLITSLSLLSGCNNLKNENAVIATNNLEKAPIELTARNLEYLVKQNYSFPLLTYTEGCSTCQIAKDNLKTTAKQVNYSLYQIEMYQSNIDYLVSNLPNLFTRNDYYPSLYIIDNGKISYKASYSDLQNQGNLKKLINAYSINSNIYTLSSLEKYNSFTNKNQNFLLYTYSSDEYDEASFYSQKLLPLASKSDKKTLIIDKCTSKTELITKIDQNINDSKYSITVFENGQIKTTLDLLNQSGDNITDLLLSFFDVDSISGSR